MKLIGNEEIYQVILIVMNRSGYINDMDKSILKSN